MNVETPRSSPASAASVPPAGERSRVLELDGLRGIAIGAVLLMHDFVRVPIPAPNRIESFFQTALSASYAGVDLFFVLSGFLIGGILLQARTAQNYYRAFYVRRYFRIIPLYGVLLATALLFPLIFPRIDAVNGGHLFAPQGVPLWTYFVFLQNVAMSLAPGIGCFWLVVTWSLAIEEQFYLCMPVAVRRLEPQRLLALAVFLILLAPFLRLTLLEFSPQAGVAAVFLPVCRMDALLLGVAAACLMRDPVARAWLQTHRALLVAAAAGLGLLFIALSAGNYGFISWVVTPFGYSAIGLLCFVLLLLSVQTNDGPWSRFLRLRWLRALGIVSYFTYLFHQPVLYTLHALCRNQAPRHADVADYGLTGLALALTLILAAISWRWFERPLIERGRRTRFTSPAEI